MAFVAVTSGAAGAQLTDWKRYEPDDRMGDGRNIAFYAESSEKFPGTMSTSRPTLLIGCSKKKAKFVIMAEVQIQPDSNLEYGQRAARIKLDEAKPIRIVGSEANSGDAIYVGDAPGWIRRLAKAKFSLVEVTPFRHGPSTVKIAVAGLSAHAKEIAEHCGIQLPK